MYSIKSISDQFFFEDGAKHPCGWSDQTAAQAVADNLSKQKAMLSGVSFLNCKVVEAPDLYRSNWVERWESSPKDFSTLVKLLKNQLN